MMYCHHKNCTQGPLFNLPQWVPQCIRFDSMHVLCLGVNLLVAGNVIHFLLDYGFWGDGDESQKLLVGWQHFKTWAKKMAGSYLHWIWYVLFANTVTL